MSLENKEKPLIDCNVNDNNISQAEQLINGLTRREYSKQWIKEHPDCRNLYQKRYYYGPRHDYWKEYHRQKSLAYYQKKKEALATQNIVQVKKIDLSDPDLEIYYCPHCQFKTFKQHIRLDHLANHLDQALEEIEQLKNLNSEKQSQIQIDKLTDYFEHEFSLKNYSKTGHSIDERNQGRFGFIKEDQLF